MLKSLSLRWTSEQTSTQNAFLTDDGGPDLLNDLLKDLVNLTATLRENHLITTEMYSQMFLDLLLTQTKPSIEPSVHLDLLSMLDSAPCRPLADGGVVLDRPRMPGGGARAIFCEECSDWHSPTDYDVICIIRRHEERDNATTLQHHHLVEVARTTREEQDPPVRMRCCCSCSRSDFDDLKPVSVEEDTPRWTSSLLYAS